MAQEGGDTRLENEAENQSTDEDADTGASPREVRQRYNERWDRYTEQHIDSDDSSSSDGLQPGEEILMDEPTDVDSGASDQSSTNTGSSSSSGGSTSGSSSGGGQRSSSGSGGSGGSSSSTGGDPSGSGAQSRPAQSGPVGGTTPDATGPTEADRVPEQRTETVANSPAAKQQAQSTEQRVPDERRAQGRSDADVVADESARPREQSQSSRSRSRAEDVARQQQIQQARERVATEASEQRGQDIEANDVEVIENDDGSVSFRVEEQETFDVDWSFGLGGPEDEVEGAVDDTAEAFSEKASSGAEWLFDEETSGETAGSAVLSALGQDKLAKSYDREFRNFGRGLYTGAAELANVPGLVGGVMEGAEVGAAGVGAAVGGASTKTGTRADTEYGTLDGGDEEFLSTAYERGTAIGKQVVQQAQENRFQTGGLAVGSLFASYGAMSTAARIGPRAGAAARYTIQPGEEALGVAGYRATEAASSTRRADQLFPNQEPLIFSEEAAISGAQRLRSGASDRLSGARQRAGELMADDRAQADLTGPSRRGGDTGGSGNVEVELEDVESIADVDDARSQQLAQAGYRGKRRAAEAREDADLEDVATDYGARSTTGQENVRSVTGQENVRTVSQSPDTSRSGPTATQRRAAQRRGSLDSGDGLDLSPLENQLAMQADRPTQDFRTAMAESETAAGEGSMLSDALGRAEDARRRFDDRGESTVRSRIRELSATRSDARSQEFDTAAATRPEVSVEAGIRSQLRQGSELAAGPMGRTSVGPAETQLGGAAVGSDQDIGPRGDTGSDIMGDARTGGRSDTGSETEPGREFESEFETSFQTGTELRSELELEFELETEFESESKRELEFEGIDLRGNRQGGARDLGGQDAVSTRLSRDLINPFTGE